MLTAKEDFECRRALAHLLREDEPPAVVLASLAAVLAPNEIEPSTVGILGFLSRAALLLDRRPAIYRALRRRPPPRRLLLCLADAIELARPTTEVRPARDKLYLAHRRRGRTPTSDVDDARVVARVEERLKSAPSPRKAYEAAATDLGISWATVRSTYLRYKTRN